MNIITTSLGKGVKIVVAGRIDTTNYTELEQAVSELLDQKIPELYLDCSELSYISSSGLRVFLTIQKKMMAFGGKFLLYAMQPTIREIFDISGFSSIFAIYGTEEDALK